MYGILSELTASICVKTLEMVRLACWYTPHNYSLFSPYLFVTLYKHTHTVGYHNSLISMHLHFTEIMPQRRQSESTWAITASVCVEVTKRKHGEKM